MYMRAAMLGGTAIACVVAAAPAAAQVHSFEISAQDAASGIAALGRQADVQIAASRRDTRGKRTKAVRGAMRVEQALEILLNGTGLRAQPTGTQTYTVVPADSSAVEDGAAAQTAADDSEASEATDIVVTGSNIRRAVPDTPMPVTVTRFEDANRVGRLNVYDALRVNPALAPGAGAYSSNLYDPGGDANSAGASFINLRNLGSNRSLTLIDSRRRVASTANSSAVDLNAIPPAMIERIEVVTGGAAAIYGADAVSGAVNIITKSRISGINLTAYQGISQRGDAPETTISAATGGSFANGRGQLAVGATYLKTGSLIETDRKRSRVRRVYWANPANTGANDGIPDQISVSDFIAFFQSEVPSIYIPGTDSFYHIDNGQLFKPSYLRVLRTGEFSTGEGTTYPQYARTLTPNAPLRLAEETFSAIAKLDYELVDGVHYDARIDYARTNSSGFTGRYREDSRAFWASGAGGAMAYLDNPYMPASVRALLIGSGLTSAAIDRTYTNWPTSEALPERELINVSQGLTGKFGSSINWEVFYQYGRSTNDIRTTNTPLSPQWAAARDVIADPVTGQPVCRDATMRSFGCVPYDIFSNEPLTAAQKAWFLADLHSHERNSQELFGGRLDGTLFRLPYGDIAFAVGVERRIETSKVTPDPQASRVGVFFNVFATLPVDATSKVSEAFGELAVPLLRDLPFVHRLEIEGAYRYSSYNTFGSTHTWKLGATWEPFAGLSLRGVRSKSVRAPNFSELYSQPSSGPLGTFYDPCTTNNRNLTPVRAANCQALGVPATLADYADSGTAFGGGNPNLQPEISQSLTFGAVFRPKFIPGFEATVDYWKIDISEAVTAFDTDTTLRQCVDLPTIDNVFCANIERLPNGKVSRLFVGLVNAGRLTTRGVDASLGYRGPLGPGQIDLSFMGSYLIQREVQNLPGIDSSIVKYAGGFFDPRFKGYLLVSYSLDDFTLALGTQFVSASKYDPNATPELYDNNHIPAFVYNDLSATYRINEHFDLTFGLKNALDVKPPALPFVNNGGNGRYDTIGRYLFTKVGLAF
jgi:outer membrane receptor protein involved in Fe transport